MEKINVAELLKDCPKGMELDCYLFNGLEFDHIDTDNENYPIVCRAKTLEGNYNGHTFTEYGWYTISYDYAKCVIFPKGKTTWEGFIPPCKFKDGDVLFHSDSASNGIFIFKEILQCGSIQKVICYCDYDSEDGFCLGENHTCCWTDSKILHPATKEQREILFQKMKEAGYKWNAETKTLEKLPKFKIGDRIRHKCPEFRGERTITNCDDTGYFTTINDWISIKHQDDWELVPNKFDITTLVPFESRVLARNNEREKWHPGIWGFYDSAHQNYPYKLIGDLTRYCIPYEGNEHLLGTTDDCDECFKTWE